MTVESGEAARVVAPPPTGSGRTSRRHRRQRLSGWRWWLVAGILLAWGVRLAILAGRPFEGYSTAAIAVLFLPVLALWPLAATRIAGLVDRVRNMSRGARGWVALALAAGGVTYLYVSARGQGVRFVPVIKDEYSYLLQARMLSVGKLWMPRHPLADFFETTAVITDRVYASVYTPGTALLHAPGVRIGLPHWVTAALLSAVALALLYLVIAALADDWYALAAVLLCVGCGMFQAMWRYAMAQVPAMALGLLTVWFFLRWRARGHRLRWAAAMGAAAGLALIVRPQDAVCYVLPVATAMLLELRRHGNRRSVFASVGTCVVAAAPFLALQVVMNVGVTGRWDETAHDYYHRRDLPRLGYGTSDHNQVTARPASVSPQKQAEFDAERAGLSRLELRNRGDLLHISNRRLPALLNGTLPEPLLAVALPVGLLALGRRSRWVLAATVPLFLLVYLPWPFVLPHYPLPFAPGVLLLVLLGMRALERHAGRFETTLAAFFALAVVAAFVASMPQVNPIKRVGETTVVAPTDLDRAVRQHTPGRAVVLLRYDVTNGAKMRPFNLDVAWPDDAPVVKALDLGDRNGEIFDYYAATQPDRVFFLYDFADDTLTRLGAATELAPSRSR